MSRLVACHFGGGPWDRMARVLEWTARKNNPGWSVEVVKLEQRLDHRYTASFVANTQKLDWWAEQVQAAPDGQRLLLLDVDTFVTGPLDGAWAEEFDFAYTIRDVITTRYPFNAGAIFLRTVPAARRFMQAWADENRRMLHEPAYHLPFYRAYGGINQAALGKLLVDGDAAARLGVRVATLPCSVWNCENLTWEQFDPARTRIVHLKDGLRLAALGMDGATQRTLELARLWRALEREALAVPA